MGATGIEPGLTDAQLAEIAAVLEQSPGYEDDHWQRTGGPRSRSGCRPTAVPGGHGRIASI